MPAVPGPEAFSELAAHLCDACRAGILPVESPLCPCCGIPFRGRVGVDHLCGRCLEEPPAFHQARAALLYARTTVDLIHALKYRGRLELARPLGRLLRSTYDRRCEPVDLIVPVPLHAARMRQRGFNQADLLVRRWGGSSRDGAGPPVAPDVLQRTRPTAPQFGLGRSEREANIRGAFEVRCPDAVEDRRILLVDDVLTTGSTAEECARRLLHCGAAQVDVLTVARVL
jgi:ComF family protein